ncbi:hypothetical protein CNR22_23070 [Sphingobacteriaceae bacterium]|nr:hypothetical protein CNR22_23070 [Sphingobacteriaceae bacterium]
MNKSLKKTYFFILTLISLVILSPVFGFKKGGCNHERLMTEAVDRLKKYTLLQDFPLYMKEKKKKDAIEFKKQIITLNRGVKYKFYTVRNTDYEGLPILSIYNNEKMEFLLGITYNANLKKFYNELEFECKTTGNYCLAFNFQDGLEGCGLGVFASLIKE